MTVEAEVLVDAREGVTFVTLNRPAAANAITVPLATQLVAALEQVAADPCARLVVLRGAGRIFCGGGDLRSMVETPTIAGALRDLTDVWHTAVRRLVGLPVPVLTVVHGAAAGAGLGLVAASDIVIASETATFSYAYSKVGLSPDGATSYFLPRLLGLRRASELALTGRVLSAAEALDWGLVTQVVPAAELEGAVGPLVASLAGGPTRAFAAAKRLLADSGLRSLTDQLDAEAQTIVATGESQDTAAAIHARLTGQAPVFHGR